jgi:hypothetical protein
LNLKLDQDFGNIWAAVDKLELPVRALVMADMTPSDTTRLNRHELSRIAIAALLS